MNRLDYVRGIYRAAAIEGRAKRFNRKLTKDERAELAKIDADARAYEAKRPATADRTLDRLYFGPKGKAAK